MHWCMPFLGVKLAPEWTCMGVASAVVAVMFRDPLPSRWLSCTECSSMQHIVPDIVCSPAV